MVIWARFVLPESGSGNQLVANRPIEFDCSTQPI